MKKLLLVSAATFIFIAGVNAQSSEAGMNNEQHEQHPWKRDSKRQKLNNISMQARDQFVEEFGAVPDVKWMKTAIFYRASFRKEGQHFKVYYDEQAKQVGTLSPRSFHDLPANAQQYINSTYKGFKKKNVIYFDDNELNQTDMLLYGKQFENMDSYFVELKKGSQKIVLKVNTTGEVVFFKQLK
jgi:hypothetical protein